MSAVILNAPPIVLFICVNSYVQSMHARSPAIKVLESGTATARAVARELEVFLVSFSGDCATARRVGITEHQVPVLHDSILDVAVVPCPLVYFEFRSQFGRKHTCAENVPSSSARSCAPSCGRLFMRHGQLQLPRLDSQMAPLVGQNN